MFRYPVFLLPIVVAIAGYASASTPESVQSAGCKEASSFAKCDCTPPEYPAYDLRNENQGTVKAKVSIDTDGKVEKVELSRSSGYKGLDTAAVEYFRRACYKAGKDGAGNPVPGVVDMQYRFQLR